MSSLLFGLFWIFLGFMLILQIPKFLKGWGMSMRHTYRKGKRYDFKGMTPPENADFISRFSMLVAVTLGPVLMLFGLAIIL